MATTPHAVSINLLGRFEVTVDGHLVPAASWRRRHAAALVKLLALTPHRTLHREQIIDVLWPDLGIAEAAPRLHKAAHFARRACGVDSSIELRSDVVTLFAGSDVVVDALEFEAAAAAALADGDRAAAAASADQYVGDLLPEDLYQSWADDTRDRLRLLHIGALRLAQRWEVLAAADPTDEAAHVALARQHLERGDPRSALRQLERCEEVLGEQLDVGLGPEAAALLAEVRRSLVARSSGSRSETSARADRSTADEPVQSVLSSAWTSDMAGRDRESAEIARAWRRASEGHASFVFLGGEPGIGKTTLAAHAAHACRSEGGRILFGRSDPEIDIPYQPFSEAFHHWCSHVDAPERQTSASTAALLRRLAPMTDVRSDAVPDQEASRDVLRNELFDAIREWLELLASERATVFVLDDLHWADDASLSVLRNVIRHPPRGPLLLLGTYRPEETGRDHALRRLLADARGDPGVFRVDLAGISATDVEAMVAATSTAPLPPEGIAFATALHERTNGNPLFAQMTLRHLIDNRVIEPDEGRWIIDESFAGLSVAAGVTEVVERRLALLDENIAAGVQVAAVLGDTFDLRTLAAVLELDDRQVIGMLADAAAVGLVTEVPDEIDRYRFGHALIRDALEASVPRSRRLRVHWDAGRALESMGSDRHLDEIVHHLTLGAPVGDSHHAAVACIRAGYTGLRRLAFEQARTHFTKALSLLDPDEDPDLAWQALNGRGEATGALLDQNERPSLDHLDAAAIARAQGWPDRLARSALGFAYFQMPGSADRSALHLLDDALHTLPDDEYRLRCEALAAHAIQCVAASDGPAARSSADHSLLIARRLDDPALIATALSARCYVLLGSPAVEELRRSAIEAVSRPLPPEGRFIPPHYALGVVAIQRGRRADLDRAIEDVRRAAEDRHSVILAVFLPSWDAAIALAAGDFAGSHRHAAVARDMSSAPAWAHAFAAHVVARRIELGRESDVVDALMAYVAQVPHARAQRCILANLLLRRGDTDLALEHLVELRDRSWAIDGWDSAICLRHLGEIAVAMPDAEMVDALLTQVAAYTDQLLTSFTGVTIEAAADRVRGQLLLALGRADDAVDAFDAARSIEVSFGAHALGVRTAYWQARARLAAGGRSRRAEARAMAEDATTSAERLGMAGLVRDLGALEFT